MNPIFQTGGRSYGNLFQMPGQNSLYNMWNGMNRLQQIGMTAPSPAGDILGFAGDMQSMYQNPAERTPANFGLSALGLLPFVPAGMTKVTRINFSGKIDKLREESEALKRSAEGMENPDYVTTMDKAFALDREIEQLLEQEARMDMYDILRKHD